MNNEFVWDEKTVFYCVEYIRDNIAVGELAVANPQFIIDKFKQSHSPKTEVYHCANCGQDTRLHEAPAFKCPPQMELARKAWLKFQKHIVDNYLPKPQAESKPEVLIHSVQRPDKKIIAIGDDEYKQGTVKSMQTNGEVFAITEKGTWSISELEDIEKDRPDWEITKYEFLPLSNKELPFWIENNSAHWEDAKTNKDYKIFEVKRLSDEITFWVGEITYGGNKIHAFEIIGDHLQVHMQTVSNPKQGWFTNIQSLVKKRPQKEEQSSALKMETPIGDFWVHREVWDKLHAMPKFASLKEEQRIEVAGNFISKDGHTLVVNISKELPVGSWPKIKQAIEQVLNDEDIVPEVFSNIFEYTQHQVDELCEKAFVASRKIDFSGKHVAPYYRYSTYQDYKKANQ